MPAEIIDVHRVTLMWRMWREIGQTLRQFDSEDDLGPKSHHEGPCKDQTVIIKQKQGPEAPESHRDCTRHCGVNPEPHTDVRTYSDLQRLFHGCRVPVHKEPRLRHWLELCSSCTECPGWPPLCSAPLRGSQPQGQLEGWQSSLWPCSELSREMGTRCWGWQRDPVRSQASSRRPWPRVSVGLGMPLAYLHAASQFGEWANVAGIHLKGTM